MLLSIYIVLYIVNLCFKLTNQYFVYIYFGGKAQWDTHAPCLQTNAKKDFQLFIFI